MRKGLFVLLMFAIAVSGGMAMFRIGMTAIVDHPALEATREGIIDELIRRGFALGTDFVVEFQSAQGNMSTAVAIANYFRSNPFD
ncbi:MAG: ABC transporter substrate binding protein, partial [Thermotogota bacterium]|nr:ABC transporter substrate binding protein [Thermotogota bacterium]